jgi:hypothetical protein
MLLTFIVIIYHRCYVIIETVGVIKEGCSLSLIIVLYVALLLLLLVQCFFKDDK